MRNPYRLLERQNVFNNRFLTLYADHVELPTLETAQFAWLTVLPGVLTLALDADRNIHMVREWKYGLGRPNLELVGGAIDQGEEPLHAAQRELKEEAGISARKWTAMGVVDPFTTFMHSPNHHFLAEDVYESPHPPDENEVLELVKLPLSEAVDRVMTGEITHSPSCVLILKTAELLRRR